MKKLNLFYLILFSTFIPSYKLSCFGQGSNSYKNLSLALGIGGVSAFCLDSIFRSETEKEVSFLKGIKEDSFFKRKLRISWHRLKNNYLSQALAISGVFGVGFFLALILEDRNNKKFLEQFSLKKVQEGCQYFNLQFHESTYGLRDFQVGDLLRKNFIISVHNLKLLPPIYCESIKIERDSFGQYLNVSLKNDDYSKENYWFNENFCRVCIRKCEKIFKVECFCPEGKTFEGKKTDRVIFVFNGTSFYREEMDSSRKNDF